MRFLRERFGKNLQSWIDQSEYDQKEIAGLVGVEPPNVSRWCSGVHFPKDDVYETLKKVTGLTDDQFFSLPTPKTVSEVARELTTANDKILALESKVFQYETFIRRLGKDPADVTTLISTPAKRPAPPRAEKKKTK